MRNIANYTDVITMVATEKPSITAEKKEIKDAVFSAIVKYVDEVVAPGAREVVAKAVEPFVDKKATVLEVAGLLSEMIDFGNAMLIRRRALGYVPRPKFRKPE
jgi:energy-converting hydrogenase Eha subunit A